MAKQNLKTKIFFSLTPNSFLLSFKLFQKRNLNKKRILAKNLKTKSQSQKKSQNKISKPKKSQAKIVFLWLVSFSKNKNLQRKHLWPKKNIKPKIFQKLKKSQNIFFFSDSKLLSSWLQAFSKKNLNKNES